MFERVHLERQVDQGMTIYTGARTEELERWVGILGIEPEERLEVLDQAQVMVQTACAEMNRRNAEAFRRSMERQRARQATARRR